MTLTVLATRPLYLQVGDFLAERIATGEWKSGRSIPNELDLAREYQVSMGTMRKALNLLRSQRLISRQRGRGTFVTDRLIPEQDLRLNCIRGPDGERIIADVESAEITEGAANEIERKRLCLLSGDRVYRTRRRRLIGELPFILEEASLPAKVFPGLPIMLSLTHRIATVAHTYGILLGKGEERISIRVASATEVESLGVAPSSPIMVLDRVMRSLDGRAIEWRVGRCQPAAHHYWAEIS